MLKKIISKIIDKKFEKLEYVKMREDKFGAQYRKYHRDLEYTQVISIMHKESGKHIIQSYESEMNKDGFNNMVGLTLKECKLALAKARVMFK